MKYTVKPFLDGIDLKEYQIVTEHQKSGLVYREENTLILPFDYDDIKPCSKNLFVLYQQGKVGAVRTEGNQVFHIAECCYDTLDIYGDSLIFCNRNVIRYYHGSQKSVYDFLELTADGSFFYGKDENYQYILSGESGEILLKKSCRSFETPDFLFCGDTERGPAFYDVHYSSFFYPLEVGYRAYQGQFFAPVMVNGKNLCNITENDGKFGVIDSYGNEIFPNCYEVVNAQLKLTAVNNGETVEKTITIPQSVFSKWITHR